MNLDVEKKDVQCECRPHRIIIQLQIEPKTPLFSKWADLKCISLIEILLWCAVFAGFMVIYLQT